MQSLFETISPPGGVRGRDRSKTYAGAMGAFALLAVFFTQSIVTGSFTIVAYGFLLEIERRAFQWLYARAFVCECPLWLDTRAQGLILDPEPRVSTTYTQGDSAYKSTRAQKNMHV
jgi:hypothetical protein